jgi:hypothetical protein
VRQRLTLPRVPKRAAPCGQAKRLSAETKQVIRDAIEHTPHLGPNGARGICRTSITSR